MQSKVSVAAVSPPAQAEDGTLVAAIVRRQPEALEQLYDRYHTMVYHLALRILQSQESAEEVVEEVFWQVWRNAERYEAQRGGVGNLAGDHSPQPGNRCPPCETWQPRS